MDLSRFIQERRPQWRRLEEIIGRVEGSGMGTLEPDQAVEFGTLYRRTASDLNQAQAFVGGETTVQYLNDLVARCYLVIYGRTQVNLLGVLRFLLLAYPAVFRQSIKPFLLAVAFFVAGSFFGYLASSLEPSARDFLLSDEMPTIQPEQAGEEDSGHLLTSGELAGFSSFLFTHNVSVSLAAFALGITFGVGTAWLTFYNGVLLGALAAVFAEGHQWLAFATGVLPHGVLEIPAALIGAAAGFVLADGLLRARPWPRLAELGQAGRRAILLLAGCFPLLAVAAMLEAGVARAPAWFLSSGLKLAVAGVFGLLFVAYLLLVGRNHRR